MNSFTKPKLKKPVSLSINMTTLIITLNLVSDPDRLNRKKLKYLNTKKAEIKRHAYFLSNCDRRVVQIYLPAAKKYDTK